MFNLPLHVYLSLTEINPPELCVYVMDSFIRVKKKAVKDIKQNLCSKTFWESFHFIIDPHL